ncbi:MAG: M23 family metallopeptidase [Bacteroidaceae bacterium]|nr:M23 family metallopeptidase [Bacteroidaceae bacterium]
MNLNQKQLQTAAFALFSLFAINTNAQDSPVPQAPADRPLNAIQLTCLDNVEIVPEAAATRFQDGYALYDSWNNTRAHCYANTAKPDSFDIDLSGFHMPVASTRVSSNFGYRPRFRRVHKGMDIGAATGDTIYAAWDGKVRIVRYEANGYGNFVVVRHPNGLETIYGHMSKQLCSVDQEVKAGQPIGLVGNTGRSFGSHLHFETRLLGEAIDPSLLFDIPGRKMQNDHFVYRRSDSQNGVVMARK